MSWPEHEKLLAVKDESQTIGEFLDSSVYQLCEYREFVDAPEENGWYPVSKTINAILADHFGIDMAVIDAEKRAMLDALRAEAVKR